MLAEMPRRSNQINLQKKVDIKGTFSRIFGVEASDCFVW
jgi:hypothetical protein